MKRIAIILVMGLLVAGCSPPEVAAFRTLTGSKAIIESEMGKHGECQLALGATGARLTPICTAINQAIPAQHAAVLILDAYCASPDYLTNQGPCRPPTDPNVKADLRSKLETAVANLNPLIAAIKQAAGAKP